MAEFNQNSYDKRLEANKYGYVEPIVNTTIQTHNNTSVSATSWSSPSAWIDSKDYSKIGLTFAYNASIDNEVLIQWSHDALNIQGEEANVLPKAVARFRAVEFVTKARYVRVLIKNNDASARTLNSWMYLKP